MEKKVIILSEDGVIFESNQLIAHSIYLKHFCFENKINHTQHGTSYEIAMDLTDSGYFPILVENKMLICFVPEVVTDKQRLFFDENDSWISRMKIMVADMNGGMVKYLTDDLTAEEEGYTVLNSVLDEKTIYDNEKTK